MIPVSLYHPTQYTQLIRIDSHQTVFCDYQYTFTVTSIQHFGSHGVMRGPISITSKLLQLFQTILLQSIRDSDSYSGMILMHVHPFQLQRFSIQNKSFVRIENGLTDSERSRITIHQIYSLINLCHQLIKVWAVNIP